MFCAMKNGCFTIFHILQAKDEAGPIEIGSWQRERLSYVGSKKLPPLAACLFRSAANKRCGAIDPYILNALWQTPCKHALSAAEIQKSACRARRDAKEAERGGQNDRLMIIVPFFSYALIIPRFGGFPGGRVFFRHKFPCVGSAVCSDGRGLTSPPQLQAAHVHNETFRSHNYTLTKEKRLPLNSKWPLPP